MSISSSRYVDIRSRAAGLSQFVTRRLGARFFTNNILLPANTFLQFTSAADVSTYFGQYSEEYYRAAFYFSFISKSTTTPQAIQFARWANAATAPRIFPIPNLVFNLTAWNAVTDGSLNISINDESYILTGLNFSLAADAAGVASILQTAIHAIPDASAMFTSSTVQYITPGVIPGVFITGFYFVGGQQIDADISISPTTTGTDISSGSTGAGGVYLGWFPGLIQNQSFSKTQWSSNAIYAFGSNEQSITDILTYSDNVSNNFGSFGFMNNLSLTADQILEAAQWNNSKNVRYMYNVPVIESNYVTISNSINDLQGTQLTLSDEIFVYEANTNNGSNLITDLPSDSINYLYVGMPVSNSGASIPSKTFLIGLSIATNLSVTATMSANATATVAGNIDFKTGQYPEQFPAMILDSTNYSGVNTAQNYMFQQVAGLNSTVRDDSSANAFDAYAVNYYGQTQESGRNISFYQRGLLQGSGVATNITDMTAYVNEIWLKDAILVAVMNLLLSQTQVSADSTGRSQILTTIQIPVNQALLNGTIRVGKPLTPEQISYITSQTLDDSAWYQVQNSGYWLDVVIEVIPDSSPQQWRAVYTLIYSKDDVIRFVQGSDILI